VIARPIAGRDTARRVRAVLLAPAAVLLAAIAARPAVAQPPAGGPPMGGPGGGGRGAGMLRAMLFEGITLTDAQQATVDSIQGASRERMMARMQGGAPADEAARAARRQEMQQEMQKDRAAMRAALTAEQQRVFDANVARMAERMRERAPAAGGPR
jgi:Spy/CpxP family protein refolding chaperone